jgi:hypothetical protein
VFGLKKFVSGVIVGVLLFCSVSVFADSVGLVGKKVSGTYTVIKDGKKIADAAIINGSAYAPVRAVSEAAGASLTVEGKTIVMESSSLSSTTEEISAQVNGMNIKRGILVKSIEAAQGGVKLYETTYLPEAQQRYDTYKGTEYEQKAEDWLADRTKEYEQRKADLTDLQQQLTDLDSQIAELQK